MDDFEVTTNVVISKNVNGKEQSNQRPKVVYYINISETAERILHEISQQTGKSETDVLDSMIHFCNARLKIVDTGK